MLPHFRRAALLLSALSLLLLVGWGAAQNLQLPKAYLDGNGPGWRALTEDDFTDVNGLPETWEWKDGLIKTTGKTVKREDL